MIAIGSGLFDVSVSVWSCFVEMQIPCNTTYTEDKSLHKKTHYYWSELSEFKMWQRYLSYIAEAMELPIHIASKTGYP